MQIELPHLPFILTATDLVTIMIPPQIKSPATRAGLIISDM
jgi:hypothetical protein